jgi:multiple sugar transport system permease protein/raffinose/stachyose/melibiose transport system permease protein
MNKELKHDFPIHIFLIILGILTFYPFVFTIITSFKDNFQFIHNFWGITWPLHLSNYTDAWSRISRYILNSAIVTTSSAFGVLAIASISAFVFARFNFPGREFLFLCILSLLMIPGILTLVPAFLLVKRLGLLNTYWVLILPYISGGQVFAIFILRSFIASLPEELFEAARVDGATTFQSFFSIAVPLSKPILVTVAIMNVLSTWNDYVWPLVTIPDGRMWTITVGIVSFSSQYGGLEMWGPMFAGYVIASIPLIVLFFFTMRYFIAGLTSGALKV